MKLDAIVIIIIIIIIFIIIIIKFISSVAIEKILDFFQVINFWN